MNLKIVISIIIALHFSVSIIECTRCPNGFDTCPKDTTCCQLRNDEKRFGCCPYKNAQCCSDKIHCCAAGTHCNVAARSCDKNQVQLKWMVPVYDWKNVTKTETINAHSNRCPDGNTCSSTETCCQMPAGNYGCCPYSKAVCCADKQHCCPEHYECDVAKSACLARDRSPIHSLKRLPIFNYVKEDFESYKFSSPSDMFFSPQKRVTFNPQKLWKSNPQNPSKNVLSEDSSDIICPNKQERCPTNTTCCVMDTRNNYGCCPMPKAVCCSDLRSCCPHGYVCTEDDCKLDRKMGFFFVPFRMNKIQRN